MVRGFTLIELSIVLIIIGLLVGGVLAGRDLIDQAKINGVTRDWLEIQTAFNTFQLKYGDGVTPGDMDNAHDYWGSDCHATAGTCNGDGDGLISDGGGEDHMVFKHMSLAGVYPGDYVGSGSVVGVDLPIGAYDPAGYRAVNVSVYEQNDNFIITQINGTPTPVFTVQQAFQLDTKTDDGIASTGNTLGAMNNSSYDCVVAVGGGTLEEPDVDSLAGDVDYDLSQSGAQCRTWTVIK